MSIKISKTETIKRSEINFAPYNPRKEDKKVVEALVKNFKKIGFMGGIQYNPITKNLIGGHKRVQAFDYINKYPENDYDIKVEVFELTEKQEKAQNIFLNNKRKQGVDDYEKLALILPDIDMEIAGIEEYDVKLIESIVPNFSLGNNSEAINDLNKITKTEENENNYESQREKLKNKKKEMRADIMEDKRSFFFVVTFDDYMKKAEFLESIGINGDDTYVSSEEFLKKINYGV